MQQAVVAGIEEAGRLWSENKYFLPDVILSAGAFKAAAEIIQPELVDSSGQNLGRIVLGVVAGDMHDLGKTIVIAMLAGAGFEVIDLGVDVSVQTFVDKVRELEPDILGLGAYMTTTMLLMKDVIEGLETAGLRDQVKVLIGGRAHDSDVRRRDRRGWLGKRCVGISRLCAGTHECAGGGIK